jgi:Zn-dependent protease
MFIKTLFNDPRLFFSQLLIVVVSVCVHEYCHALAAYKLGDTTAADRGHLTLNPFKQMGIVSLLMLCFLGIAWGQIPVNPANLRGKHSRALVSASGPAANLALSLLFSILAVAGIIGKINPFAGNMLFFGAIINMVLALFNLLPIPGLDGWNILRTYWRKDLANAAEWVKGTFLVLIMLVFTCFDYIYNAAGVIVINFCRLLLRVCGGLK